MDKTFIRAEENNCAALTAAIEANVSGCEVSNLGNSLLVNFLNRSVGNIFPVTANTIDVFCLDVRGKEYDFKDVSVEKCLEVLQTISAIKEETTTGDVAGYNSAKAFSTLNEVDRLKNPFGADPLGAKARRSISENSGSNDAKQVLEYLAELLPVDSAEIIGGELVLIIDAVEIRIAPQTCGIFSVQSSIDGEPIQASDNVPTADVIRWAFEVVGGIQARVAERDSEDDDEISNNDIWGTIKELARETGKSDDILRNKDLFSLRQGLCVTRPPFDRTQSPDSFVTETSGSLVSSSLKGSTMHDGAPVSLNEGRDISRPYADTLGGKSLVYLEGIGATFANKSDLPKKLKLNFDPNSGQVIFTDESVPTCKVGMWKFFGRA